MKLLLEIDYPSLAEARQLAPGRALVECRARAARLRSLSYAGRGDGAVAVLELDVPDTTPAPDRSEDATTLGD